MPPNHDLSRRLRAHADALAAAGDNLFRVRAVRRAAATVQACPHRLADHPEAIRRPPGVGASLARRIAELAADPRGR
jgi:DNA polymerase/3'-5' exonuclease PolX